MYHHVKKLMYTVRVDEPDPRFGNMLLEQFGGANGELAAAMQYSVQGLNCEDAARKDLLMDIGTEELSHLEIVGTLARMHLKPLKSVREAAEADPLIAIAGGGGVNLFNSQGNAWTADYLKITGELDVDLRSNIAAEARAKIVYERLINFCRDAGTKDALQFLMTREITHMRAFTLALESMGKPPFSIGRIAPTPKLVDQFFNNSTGEGDYGEIDARGPWNEGGDWEFVESPAIADLNGFESTMRTNLLPFMPKAPAPATIHKGAAGGPAPGHPARRKAADEGPSEDGEVGPLGTAPAIIRDPPGRDGSPGRAANECLRFLGPQHERNPAKEWQGSSKRATNHAGRQGKGRAPADLALIGAAQRVEHYEIAAYTTARNLAVQIRHPRIVQFMTTSLGKNRTPGQLLDQLAQPLMSVAKMPASVE